MIYFIQEGKRGAIKIGHTYGVNIKRRFQNLQTAHCRVLHVLGTQDGTLHDEDSLHERFAPYHVRGEWFRPAPAVIEYIKANVTPPVIKPKIGRSKAVDPKQTWVDDMRRTLAKGVSA